MLDEFNKGSSASFILTRALTIVSIRLCMQHPNTISNEFKQARRADFALALAY